MQNNSVNGSGDGGQWRGKTHFILRGHV
jgi:hypothetical protein